MERAELKQLLTDAEYRAAARTTLNAHYTDAALVGVIWAELADRGLAQTTGRVLEPGCGSGTFIGFAPEAAQRIVGVELDPTTAAIAAALYPDAQVRAESFADSRLPANAFDLTIGNVPFGQTTLHDKVHNAGGHSLHNHFILKSLALTRPGGVVAVLTSHWTLDALNPAARREIAELADLVTAIRLPDTAHERAAGTSVITDLLVLRRRDPAGPPAPAGPAWAKTGTVGGDPDQQINVNEYFQAHPEQVIGSIGARSGQFGPELDVAYRGDVAGALHDILRAGLDWFTDGEPLFSPAGADVDEGRITAPDAPADALEGHLAVDDRGRCTVVAGGQLHPREVPETQLRELTALLGLRDTVVALLAAEAATSDDTARISELRAELNARYDTYAARYGPINRITTRRTGRVDEDGNDELARIRPPQGRFRDDPHSPAVYALEHYDATLGTASKAAIFTQRVVAPRPRRFGADTAEDAVAICLDTHGRIDLSEIARLLGRSDEDARAALGQLVFNDPEQPDRLIPAAEYLSGNVRVKLAAARAAAAADGAGDRWAVNIAALTAVQPVDLTPAEIAVRLGASWISADVVAQFLAETLDDARIRVENPGGSVWTVKGNHHGVLATSTYGTSRVSAVTLAQAVLEQRPVKVYDEIEAGQRVINLTETVAAQERAGLLNEQFADWVWADPERARTLSRIYNDTFNAIVLRSYDGVQREFPGLAVTITLREHQVAAVVRMLSEPTVLLAHEVGAGKTLEIVVGCMEMRRLGMATKPAVVVPNHMLEQFSREWMQAYPQARILAASSDDLTRGRRRLFVARVATGDWDAVILSRTAFERLPLTPEMQQAYLDGQLDQLRGQLEKSKAAGGLTVKRLQGALQRAEERLKKLTDVERDPAITFETSGIDYLCVDEAHAYKNLRLASNIPGTAKEGSQRASDLDMKLGYLRSRHGARIATFATATPIANSMSEAYIMQRYLRPDVLDAAGLVDFDVWAATFGEISTDLELSPDGTSYRMQSRFCKFRNVPELLRMWHLSADIKTAEDLHLPTPAIAGGKPETVVVPATPELTEFMRSLAHRAEQVKSRAVDAREDNMLRVATHGRMAALDLRLLPDAVRAALPQWLAAAGDAAAGRPKLDVVADRIAAIHHRNASRVYPNGPTPGAAQLVFCDLGTPTGTGWNAYTELRDLLAARGVPAHAVRFMHEARNDREKGELFAAARTGHVAVLIGSTEKMGVGTNAQARAVALHHVDCPWRPADIAQRDGRVLRQGNLNDEVEILRYVTEGSFDGYLWQTVERKARFIGQVLRGRLDVREMEDIGDTALSYAEVKALASGDPRVLEKARVDAETNRLERLQRSWARNQRILTDTLADANRSLPLLAGALASIDDALTRRRDTRGDAFVMTIGPYRYDSRPDAAAALRNAVLPLQPTYGDVDPRVVAHIGGFDVIAAGQRGHQPTLRFELAGVPRSGFAIAVEEVRTGKAHGLISKLENRVASLPQTRLDVERDLHRTGSERDRAAAEVGQPFPHAAALAQSRQRSLELATEMAKGAGAPAEDQSPPGPATDDGAAAAVPAEQRWRSHALALPGGRQLVNDPGWPALAAAIDRAHNADCDVARELPRLAAQPLDARRPAADLQYRLAGACAAAQTPLPGHGYRTSDSPAGGPLPPPELVGPDLRRALPGR